MSINEKALCSAIYGTRDAAKRHSDENSIKIEHLERELNLLHIRVAQLERAVKE